MSIDQEAPAIPRVVLEVDAGLQFEIEQFLYLEARLLDDRRFDDWLLLFADDIHYWMPTRYNRLLRELDKELAAPNEVANFDEDKRSLAQRVFRINTGMAWAEDPLANATPRVQCLGAPDGDWPHSDRRGVRRAVGVPDVPQPWRHRSRRVGGPPRRPASAHRSRHVADRAPQDHDRPIDDPVQEPQRLSLVLTSSSLEELTWPHQRPRLSRHHRSRHRRVEDLRNECPRAAGEPVLH